MKQILLSLIFAFGFAVSATAQTTWFVPDDFSTIQAGINGSSNGDILIVRDGTYYENINFNGKAIHLKSQNGPATTIIDGSGNGTEGVLFNTGEGSDSIFEGFTVTNCLTGISRIGAGVGVDVGASPVIRGNHITNNTRSVPSGRTAGGSGCTIQGDGTLFEFNVVEGNTTSGTHTWGGGLMVIGSGPQGVIVRSNLFLSNTAASWPGGGGICVNDSSQNTIIENNTIFENTAYNGGGICVDYRSSGTVMRNNIVWGNTGGPNIETGGVSIVEFSCVEGGIGGVGNIAADPMFVDPLNGDFQLQAGSPCIDTGDPNSSLDPDGTPADMGAYYYSQSGLDSDNDGILNADEIGIYFTDPFDQDTDDDGLSDGEEVNGLSAPPGTGWFLNPANGHYYKEFLVPGHTWHGAVAEASAMGGYLACISDAAENQWLETTFPPRGSQQEAFLGGTDENQEGVWEWITGEPWVYTNWQPGEPNNQGGEDYLEWAGTWNDVPNSGYPSGSGTPYGITEFAPSMIGTDPLAFDSDGDGLGDGQEIGLDAIIWNGGGIPGVFGTDPVVFIPDSDPLTTTDPLLYDTDGGGTSDGNEDVDKNGALDIDEHDPNDSLDDLFQLSIQNLSPGLTATISVSECRPGSVVVPLFSMAGQTTWLFPDYNQLELALSNPINQLPGMTVGPHGTAFSLVGVPPFVSIGVNVYWQAVEITGGGDAYRPSIPIIAVVQ